MSELAVIWARRTRVGSLSARVILLELAWHADVFDFHCAASIDELADACEISERTTKEGVARLETLGLIGRRRRYDEDGRRISDEYTVHVDVSVAIPRKLGQPRGPLVSARRRALLAAERGAGQ